VGLLLLFILWFFYLSFRFQREYQELNRQLLINSDIGKSTALVMQTRGRVREVLLHYRMTRAQRYLQELSTLNQQTGMREQFESAGCPLPAVDPCPESSGNWDRLRIEQVVTNLLTNALRYGNRKPVTVTIQARAGWVELRVRDQGIGIEPQNLKVIFDRFERAVNSNEVSGLGLGLFVTRQIVLAHHGRITVDSEIGKGSVFTVQLPRGH
jgi:light-regulated signal transduction histidine kinase (bacteriophytochrome)